MTAEEIAERFDSRVGYSLVSYGVVGLPVYRLTAVALCLTRKPISPIDEFVMRLVVQGVNTVRDIAGFLGLEEGVVEASLSELLRLECVRTASQTDGGLRIQLTPKGTETARDHEMETPAQQTIVFSVDGLTRKPRLYPPEILIRPRQLKEFGVPEIRAFPSKPPELADLDIKDIVEVVRLENGPGDAPRQLLRLNSLERRDRMFLDAVALAYRSDSGKELQIGFAIDGRLSIDHEQAFSRSRGLERTTLFQGLREETEVPGLDRVLGEKLSRKIDEAFPGGIRGQRCRPHARAHRPAPPKGPTEGSGRTAAPPVAEEPSRTETSGQEVGLQPEVRPLAVYEHGPLLKDAIETAKARLLIVCPWIRRAVVDQSFIRALRHALGRGVSVFIGYGIGGDHQDEFKDCDRNAVEDLKKLALEIKALKFRRLGDTHAKVLIKDDEFFVISSFNWLSFRGDPHRTFREEWGALVSVKASVDDFFERMAARFKNEG